MERLVPQISIIMATFNRANLIGEALESIKSQTFENWECIIIDDGSSDNTFEIIKRYQVADSRFKYFVRSNDHLKGLPGCRNEGIEKANGKLIVFFDDDDIVHPMNLEICNNEFSKANIDFCRYERAVFTGDFQQEFDLDSAYKSKEINLSNLEEIAMGQIPFNSCQVMWKREYFQNNKFNENLMYAEEWECYLRLLSNGLRGLTLDKVLFFGRKHTKSNTGEFWNHDPVRRKSKVMAVKLVINNLKEKNLLTHRMSRYFIQLSIFLKDKSVLKHVLEKKRIGRIKRIQYFLLYDLYPVIVLGHRAKKMLIK